MSEPPPRPRMYYELAHLWTLISAPEDYAEEARHWRQALYDKLGAGHHEILELGVGGGNNLSHILRPTLAKGKGRDEPDPAAITFKATAVDISDQMLDNSRRLNPEVEHHVGDMRTVRLNRKFDAVLIHDAISYMTSEEELSATFATAAAHLEPGGVFITTPDHFEESFVDDVVGSHTIAKGDFRVTRIEYTYRLDPDEPVYETMMFFMIREGEDVSDDRDLHQFGVFPVARWRHLMKQAGFEVELRPYDVHEDHRKSYLLVGVLR